MRCNTCRWVDRQYCGHTAFKKRRLRPFILVAGDEDRPQFCPLKLCEGCDIELEEEDSLIGWCGTCGTWLEDGPVEVINVEPICALCRVPFKPLDAPPSCRVCQRNPTPPHSHWYASCSRHNRSSLRPLPTPSTAAYSHNATSSFGSVAARPGSLPRAAIGS